MRTAAPFSPRPAATKNSWTPCGSQESSAHVSGCGELHRLDVVHGYFTRKWGEEEDEGEERPDLKTKLVD